MKGLFARVRNRLAAMMRTLKPDEYFYVICFGNGRLFEIGDGYLVRATARSVEAAAAFVGRMRPEGRTNMVSALERSLRISGKGGRKISAVCLLTDGFELADGDFAAFDRGIWDLLESAPAGVKVDIIAFWPRSGDAAALRRIAQRSGGEFVLLGEADM
jgi:Mg-chelatase subunit ChlD